MAKRVNTPFVTVVAAVCFLGFGIVILGPKLKTSWGRRVPVRVAIADQVKLADGLVQQGRYREAVDAITTAWLMDRTDKELCVKRGDMLTLLVDEDGFQVMETARTSWINALEIDPRYTPALTRLLDSFVDQMDVAPSPNVCVRLRDAAQRMLTVDKDNVRAKAYFHIATIQQWVLGTSKTAQEIAFALDALQEVQKTNPTMPEALFYICRGKSFSAAEAYRTNRVDVGKRLLNECRALLDATTAAYPKDAELNFRAFQGYVMLADTGRDVAQVAQDKAAADVVLRAASQNVKDSDTRYADFQYVASEWARRNGRPDESEKILRAFYGKRKNDQRARLALAHILAMTGDPAKRDEAIAILSQPVFRTGENHGKGGVSLRELESQTLLDLTSLRVALYPTLEPAKRPGLMVQIDEAYKKLDAMSRADAVPVLRLKGLIHQLKGQNVEAVEALSRAMTVLEHTDPNNAIKYDLMYQLATIDRLAGQNHSAEKLLIELVNRFETYIPARLQLAEALLEENNLTEAAKHIAILAKQRPGAQEVLRLQVSLSQRGEQSDDVRKLYNQLVEGRFEEKLIKAQVAARLKNFSEVIRLLTAMQTDKPDEAAIVVAIFEAYAKSGDRPKAQQILTDALRRRPKDGRLLLLQEQFNASTWEAPDTLMEELLEVTGDQLFHEIQQGRRALREQNFADALDHAKAADQIRPDDPATWDLYFQIYKQEQNWEASVKAVMNLQRLDADHAGGRMYRWTLAMSRGRYPEAINIARDLTVYRESFGQSWVLLAEALESNGQYNEALKNYQAALERQTTNIDAYKGMADCYENLSQPERAREIIEQGRHMFPENTALRERAYDYDLKVNPIPVIAARKKILDQNPNDPENYIALATANVRAAQKIFTRDPLAAKNFTDTARDVLTRGVGKFPEDLRLNRELANSLRASNLFEEGVKVLRDVARTPKWKDRPDPQIVLAEYYVNANRSKDAEQAFRDAFAVTKNRNIDIELRLANYFQILHRYDDALTLLKENADDPRIVQQTLQIHIAAGHSDEARKGLNEALAKSPENVELLNLLGVVYIDALKYPEARAVFQKVKRIDPRNDTAIFFGAMAELRDPINGSVDTAIKDLNTVVYRNPRNVQYRLLYVDALMRVRDIEGAAVELQGALRLDPLNREVRLRLLDAYSRLKKWSQFEQELAFAEQNPAISGPVWCRAHAYGLATQGKFPEAIAKMRDAIAMDPNNPVYRRDFLIVLLEAKQYEDVIIETDNLINSNHHEWWVYHLRALTKFAAGKQAEAMEQFDKALAEAVTVKDDDAWQQVLTSIAEISPDKALDRLAPRINSTDPHADRWRLQSISLRLTKRDWTKAISELQSLIPRRDKMRRDDRLSVIRYAAETYQAAGQPDIANKFYAEWLKEAPNDTAALNNYAYLLCDDLKNPQEAAKYSQKAYNVGRKWNDPMILDTHGWVLIQCGGSLADEGLTILTNVVESNPQFLEARYHRAMAYLKRNRVGDASVELDTAMAQIKTMEEKKQAVRPQVKAEIQEAIVKVQKAKSIGK